MSQISATTIQIAILAFGSILLSACSGSNDSAALSEDNNVVIEIDNSAVSAQAEPMSVLNDDDAGAVDEANGVIVLSENENALSETDDSAVSAQAETMEVSFEGSTPNVDEEDTSPISVNEVEINNVTEETEVNAVGETVDSVVLSDSDNAASDIDSNTPSSPVETTNVSIVENISDIDEASTPTVDANEVQMNTVIDESEDSSIEQITELATPDPLIQNATRVDFDITVPAYQSRALQVWLEWGDKNLVSAWVGDEMWSASDEFPVSTEHLLTVTFYDDNGDIVLGSYESPFRTGTNASETYQINADDFDTAKWDTDEDGTSNLNELLVGDNPLVDERQSLEIRDGFNSVGRTVFSNLSNFAGTYEARIPDERPYFEDTSVVNRVWEYFDETRDETLVSTTDQTIDIDANGNASFSKYDYEDESPAYFSTMTREGTRTNTGTSIQWSSTYSFYSVEHGCRTNDRFTSETTRLDDGSVSQQGHQFVKSCFLSSGRDYEVTYTFTGTVTDDSPLCEVTAGSIIVDPINLFPVTGLEYSKQLGDIYWHVKTLDNEGQLITEYLDPIDLSFYCDFADI